MSYRDISPDNLRLLYSYDPQSGEIRSKGLIVGYRYIDSRYLTVSIDRRTVPAHVLAWALMTGQWPELSIDHINRDGFDNSWLNLRLATDGQQQANRRGWSKSGVRGVNWDRGKWVAYVRHDGKTKNLGRFSSKEEAGAVVEHERKRIWGEFAEAV